MVTIRPTIPAAGAGAAANGASAPRAPSPAASAPGTLAPASAVPLRQGARLGAANAHQLQGQVAAAQQALGFLSQVNGQLEAIKSTLSRAAGGRQDGTDKLADQLARLERTMERRRQESGGSVDADLNFSGPSQATQQFRVRGLNLDMLQGGTGQVLAFSVGAGQPLTVALEAGMSRQQIVQQLDRALAPASVRVGADAAGALVFSTPESCWPTVRETLAIQGVGRLAVEADAGIVQTGQWGAGGPAAMRQSLPQVVRALARGRSAEQAAGAALETAAARADALQPAAADMRQLAHDFAGTAGTPSYQSLLAVRSALDGISRERVQALLRPR